MPQSANGTLPMKLSLFGIVGMLLAVPAVGAEVPDKFIREYVWPRILEDKTLTHSTVLMVVNSLGLAEPALTVRLSKTLSQFGVANDIFVFTPAFISSPAFTRYLTGSIPAGTKFPAEDFAARLLIIQTKVRFRHIIAIDSVDAIIADSLWAVQLVLPSDGRVVYRCEIRVEGIGRTETVAENSAIMRAERKLIKIAPCLVPESIKR